MHKIIEYFLIDTIVNKKGYNYSKFFNYILSHFFFKYAIRCSVPANTAVQDLIRKKDNEFITFGNEIFIYVCVYVKVIKKRMQILIY